MNRKAQAALKQYKLKQPIAKLIRHNENMTYHVTDGERQYVLRIHSPVEGFSAGLFDGVFKKSELILSELEIISALKGGSEVKTQQPVPGKNGEVLQRLEDGTPVTLLKWLDGETVDSEKLTPELFFQSGAMMARMHLFFGREKQLAKRYARYSYDQSILPVIAARIKDAEIKKVLASEQASTILAALDEMRLRFDELDAREPKRIVHADMGKSNVILLKNGGLAPIDFSLCGYSHIYMDIGGIYGLDANDPGRRQIVEGYKSVYDREILPRFTEPYFALGVLLFIACQYERAKSWAWFPDNMARWHNEIFEPLSQQKPFLEI